MIIAETSDLLIVNKWAGIATHSVGNGGELGLVELATQSLDKGPLFVVHRLDKTTTGVLVFAKNKEAAEGLRRAFAERIVKKTYLFLTASRSSSWSYEVFSQIEQEGRFWVSSDQRISKSYGSNSVLGKAENAWTRLQCRKRNYGFEQWEAHPQTGKTHQIRLHAAAIGLPILGDSTYGGATFPHLCLHAEEIEIPGFGKWRAEAPLLMQRYGLGWDIELVRALSAIDLRMRRWAPTRHQSLRLVDREVPQFRLDLLGENLALTWLPALPPSGIEQVRLQTLARFLGRKMYMRLAGEDAENKLEGEACRETWLVEEGCLKFEIRTNQGLQLGLFQDFRHLRRWILDLNLQGKRVLNTFAYTCSLSVAAAKAGAEKVMSVDLSRVYLEWGQCNFRHNGIDPAKHVFLARDARETIEKMAAKANTKSHEPSEKFDLVILDPPSFARSKKSGPFQVRRDLPSLARMAADLVNPNGHLVVASNFEKWGEREFEREISLPRAFRRIELAPSDGDFSVYPLLGIWQRGS